LAAIYLIRHAQAGPRDNYDALSQLGHAQARLLGEYLAVQGVQFAAIYAGSMRRQQQTARAVSEAYKEARLNAPAITTDERWNEFNLAAVYRAIARRMCRESEAFAQDFEEMQRALLLDPHATGGAVGRCDGAVMRAWMEGRYPDCGEQSWPDFQERVQACKGDLARFGRGEAVAVFTSATPIAVWAGMALGLSIERMIKLTGVLYNSGLTTMRLQGDELTLFTLNCVSHLSSVLMRTFR